MSLYYVQKVLFALNRDAVVQQRFRDEPQALLGEYDLTPQERAALTEGDIGLLFVMGVNGQLLMHLAAFLQMPWAEYLEAMREGVRRHGPVRAGVYAMTLPAEEKVAGL